MENKLDTAYEKVAYAVDVAEAIYSPLTCGEIEKNADNAASLAAIVKDYCFQGLQAIEEAQAIMEKTA